MIKRTINREKRFESFIVGLDKPLCTIVTTEWEELVENLCKSMVYLWTLLLWFAEAWE